MDRCRHNAALVSCGLGADAAANPAAAPARVFQWHPFLAPFHAVALHLPIGFLTMGVILEFYRLRHPSSELKKVLHLVMWLTLLSSIVTAGFGILRASGGGYDAAAVERHRWSPRWG